MARCSGSGFGNSGIGAEHMRLNFCTDDQEFTPSAVPRLRDAKTRTRSVSGSSHGGIGVEDVHLQFRHDLEGFCPSAVPRIRHAKTITLSAIGSPLSVDEDPLSVDAHRDGDRTRQELQPRGEIEPCVPQILGQVRETGRDQHGAGSHTAFAVNSNILRGVQAGVVLRRCAWLLKSAAGSEATFLLSRPTDHLGAFISHNWSVSRCKKWVALCHHFNFLGALVCGILAATVLCVAIVLGCLPLPAVAVAGWSQEHMGIYCCVCGSLVFYVVLLFGSDVLPARLLRYHEVFLDKACIHQVDETLQRPGIESLGSFLFYSWSMVVLYTPVYTTKVWTVYEMACFLGLHPGGRLVWLPVDLGLAVVVMSLLYMLQIVGVWATSLASTGEWLAVPDSLFLLLQNLPIVPASVCCAFIFNNVARDQVKSEADLRLFSIRNAVCAVEGDRAVVEGNVASLMRDLKLVPLDSTHEEALLAFDSMVQTSMPRAIRDSVGLAGLRYELLVTVFAPAVFLSFDVVGADVMAGVSVRAVFATLLGSSTMACAIFPLGCALTTQMCARCTHLRGLKGIVFVLFVGVVLFLWEILWVNAGALLLSLAQEDISAFISHVWPRSRSSFSRSLFSGGFQDSNADAAQEPSLRRLKNWLRHSDPTFSELAEWT